MPRHLFLHCVTDAIRFAALNNRFNESNVCVKIVEGGARVRVDSKFAGCRRREEGHIFREIRG
jgi:hypothetical protein